MSTEENIGYQDAMRQVVRSLHRRLKALQDERKSAHASDQPELDARIAEVIHLVQVVESLHR